MPETVQPIKGKIEFQQPNKQKTKDLTGRQADKGVTIHKEGQIISAISMGKIKIISLLNHHVFKLWIG